VAVPNRVPFKAREIPSGDSLLFKDILPLTVAFSCPEAIVPAKNSKKKL
jgi:hypothetical protein